MVFSHRFLNCVRLCSRTPQDVKSGADGLVACDLVSEAGGVYLPVMGECFVSNESNQTLQIEAFSR